MQLLRIIARLVLVGLFDRELRLNLVTVTIRAYRLIESFTESLDDLMKLVLPAKRGLIKRFISSQFELKETTQSLQIKIEKS